MVVVDLDVIERAEREYDEQSANEAMARLQAGRFTLEDFHDQLQQMKDLASTGLGTDGKPLTGYDLERARRNYLEAVPVMASAPEARMNGNIHRRGARPQPPSRSLQGERKGKGADRRPRLSALRLPLALFLA